jgi:hypothetical protein
MPGYPAGYRILQTAGYPAVYPANLLNVTMIIYLFFIKRMQLFFFWQQKLPTEKENIHRSVIMIEPDIWPDIRYPALTDIRPDIRYPVFMLAGYPAKSVSGAFLMAILATFLRGTYHCIAFFLLNIFAL